MGSNPESIRYLLKQLECRPDTCTLNWCSPQPVTLHRGADNKLGIHFKTYPTGEGRTTTIVVRIKENCKIVSGSLHVGDRIVGISNRDVTTLAEQVVKDVLSKTLGSVVDLQVSAMTSSQVKRFLSFNASDNSVSASLDSAERPQVKRLATSGSTDTPPPLSPSNGFDDHLGVTAPSSPKGSASKEKGTACGCNNLNRVLGRYVSNGNEHVQSLPTRMEDDIIRSDDIFLSEDPAGPNSLPPVLTPLPNTPSPGATNAHMGNFFNNTVSTGIGGASAVGSGDMNTERASYKSLGVEVCRAQGCGLHKMCMWHKFVLTYPQYVIWDPSTKTVLLEKNDSVTFGFKYKPLKHDGPPAEVYVLVTEVTREGVAWTQSQLLPGDWIRSINSTPVNSAKEAYRADFRKLSSLRLVIQRPDGLSPKGVSKLRQQAQSMRFKLNIPPAPPADLPPSPTSSASSSPRPTGRPKASPNRQQQYVSSGRKSSEGSGRVGKDHNLPASPDPMLDLYPRMAQSPGEHIPLNTIVRPAPPVNCNPPLSDRSVLPSVRVVVCGTHGSAVDFVRGLFGECEGVVVNPESNVQSFHLSLHHSTDFGTMVHPRPESLTLLARDGGLSIDGRGRQESTVRCVNVELYVISDEEFFHHCSAWLLPSSTLVLLTFNVQRLLNQPEPETRRLASMVHTVRACSDSIQQGTINSLHPEVLLYGVPSGAQRETSAEEVQAIFYVTDSGTRLLEHHALAVPSVAVPACAKSMASARDKIFSLCRDRVCTVPVHQTTPKVVDMLPGAMTVKVSWREVSGLVSRAAGETDPAVLQTVLHDLLTTGMLLPFGVNRGSGEGFEQEFLLPSNIFQALSTLLIKPFMDSYSPECRQKWFKLMTTGRVSRSEFLDLLASESSFLTLDMLEQLGIVFRFQSPSSRSKGDSGFLSDASDFVVPYFLMDSTEGKVEVEGQMFVMTFGSYLTWQGYFRMLCRLSALPGTEEMVLHGQCDCVLKHNGLRMRLQWRKNSDTDTVIVSVARPERQNGEALTAQSLQQLFSVVLPLGTQFTLCPASTANPSGDLPSLTLSSSARPPTANKQHLPRSHTNEEDTSVKPAPATEDTVQATANSNGVERSNSSLTLIHLPLSILNQIAIQLTPPMPTGNDWKSVAAETGKSMAQINAYEAVKSLEVPAMTFLREWISTGTIQQLLDILEKLDRPDVQDIILNHMKGRSAQS